MRFIPGLLLLPGVIAWPAVFGRNASISLLPATEICYTTTTSRCVLITTSESITSGIADVTETSSSVITSSADVSSFSEITLTSSVVATQTSSSFGNFTSVGPITLTVIESSSTSSVEETVTFSASTEITSSDFSTSVEETSSSTTESSSTAEETSSSIISDTFPTVVTVIFPTDTSDLSSIIGSSTLSETPSSATETETLSMIDPIPTSEFSTTVDASSTTISTIVGPTFEPTTTSESATTSESSTVVSTTTSSETPSVTTLTTTISSTSSSTSSSIISSISAAPTGVKIRDVTYNGSGCPAGSVVGQLSTDKSLLTLIFGEFSAQSGPGLDPVEGRKNCQLNIALTYPGGYQHSIFKADYRGYANLGLGQSGLIDTTYYYSGQTEQISRSLAISGPVDMNYLRSDEFGVESQVWSPCGAEGALNINSGVHLTPLISLHPALMTLDSTDLKFTQIHHIVWRQCDM